MLRSVVNNREQPNVEPRNEDATLINFNLTTHQYATQPKAQKPTRKWKKTDSLTAFQLNDTPNIEFTGNSDGRSNKLDEIAWLVTELKGIIAQQGQAVQTQNRLPDQRSWASITSNSRTNGESSTPPPAPTPAPTKVDRNDPPLCIRISAAQAPPPHMDYGGERKSCC
ncbi:hypothetical protein ACJ73_03129 [Blastomyces percursus]|uniref:Uncharacterized protein n=1 Tax=Blastomyces percursus TaxID=1658174 RepID=A0A1J9QBR1_9EURO|nr:hypothetical protein ACJ73_03129 [Blastomyces percursus]